MVEFVSQLISKSNQLRRKLSVQVVGSSIIDNDTLEDKPDEAEFNIKYLDEKQETFISDIKTYKASLKAYPLHKIIK